MVWETNHAMDIYLKLKIKVHLEKLTQQGKLQGVNQSLQSVNNVLIPLGAAAINSPGTLYIIAAFIILAAIITFSNYLPKGLRTQPR